MALSLVIFRQPTKSPSKFLKPRDLVGRISKYFGFHLDLGLRDWTDNLLKYSEFDPVWILVFVSVLLNLLKPREDHCKHLDTQFRTYLSSDLSCRCTIESIEFSYLFQCTVEMIAEEGTYSCIGKITRLLFERDCCVGRDPHLILRCGPRGLETRISCNTEITLDASGRECHVECV